MPAKKIDIHKELGQKQTVDSEEPMSFDFIAKKFAQLVCKPAQWVEGGDCPVCEASSSVVYISSPPWKCSDSSFYECECCGEGGEVILSVETT